MMRKDVQTRTKEDERMWNNKNPTNTHAGDLENIKNASGVSSYIEIITT